MITTYQSIKVLKQSNLVNKSLFPPSVHSTILSMNRLVSSAFTRNFQTAAISASFCTQIKLAICSVFEPEEEILIPENLLRFDKREQDSKKNAQTYQSLCSIEGIRSVAKTHARHH